jgi:hypothetical protein
VKRVLGLILLGGCDAAFVAFPATDLNFDIPIVDPTTALARCVGDSATFVAQFDASGASPETLGTIAIPGDVERHPLAIRNTGSATFPARYQLGPLRTGVAAEDVIPGESTSLRCDDLGLTSVAMGMLDGFGIAVECVQWVGSDSAAPDDWQAELTDVGCMSFDL